MARTACLRRRFSYFERLRRRCRSPRLVLPSRRYSRRLHQVDRASDQRRCHLRQLHQAPFTRRAIRRAAVGEISSSVRCISIRNKRDVILPAFLQFLFV